MQDLAPLVNLLRQLFSPQEAFRLARMLDGGEDVFANIAPPDSVSPIDAIDGLVEALERRRLLDDTFWSVLRRERPRACDEIEHVEKIIKAQTDGRRRNHRLIVDAHLLDRTLSGVPLPLRRVAIRALSRPRLASAILVSVLALLVVVSGLGLSGRLCPRQEEGRPLQLEQDLLDCKDEIERLSELVAISLTVEDARRSARENLGGCAQIIDRLLKEGAQ